MQSILTKILVAAVALLAVERVFDGVFIESIYVALLVAAVLGVLNVLVKPVLILLTLPITILTLGLFIFVINALLFWFVASFVKGFVVGGFFDALFGSIAVSVISTVINRVIKD